MPMHNGMLCLPHVAAQNHLGQDEATFSGPAEGDWLSLAMQVASEKDLEAVMAIDKFRGVELRKRLSEVCAAVQRPSTIGSSMFFAR